MSEDGQPILGSLYIYAPNTGAPIFFAAAFFVSAIFHIWQCFRFKAWRVITLHPLCAMVLATGYAVREWGAFNFMYSSIDKLPLDLYIVSQVFIFICPPLLELANYIILNRLFSYIPSLAPLAPGRITTIFASLMGLVEGLNGAGVALTSNAKASDVTHISGHYLTLVGLCIQVLVILAFFCVSIIFHRRCIRARIYPRAIRTLILVLYASMTLIFIRCLYRLVEFTTGGTSINLSDYNALLQLSPILRYEVFFYVFEASFMLLNSVLWNTWHPGRYLPRNQHIYLTQDEGTRVAGDKNSGSRGITLSSLADFGVIGLIKKLVKALRKRSGNHERMNSETQELNDMRTASHN